MTLTEAPSRRGRYLTLVLSLALGTTSLADAQEPRFDVEPRCPPALLTADSLIAQVERTDVRAEGATSAPGGRSVWSVVEKPFTAVDSCPRFRPGVQPRVAALRLLDFALDEAGPDAAPDVLYALSVAFATRPEIVGPLPVDRLVEGLADAATEGARNGALRVLMRHVPHEPRAREAILRLARAQEGPPAWPDLPWTIVDWVRGRSSDADVTIADALRAEPSRLMNPRVRWWAVCGPAASQYHGRFPQEGDLDDPCHPAHMPPVLPSG